MEGCTTWYFQPLLSGKKTPFSQLPPTNVRPGMTEQEVNEILGSPSEILPDRWRFEVR